jgi:hypothetical protein
MLLSLVLTLGLSQAVTASDSEVATVVWNERAPAGASLAVVLAPARPMIANLNDVADDLGEGVPEDVYLTFFKQEFPQALREHSELGEVTFPPAPDMSQWQDRTLPVTKKIEARLLVPRDGDSIATTPTVRFVLVVYDLQIGRAKGSWTTRSHFVPGQPLPPNDPMNPTGQPMRPGHFDHTQTKEPDALVHMARFFLWDNKSGALVSYGWLNESNGARFGMTRTTWTKVLGKLARAILEDSSLWVK